MNILVEVGMEAPVLPLSGSHQETCYFYCCPISKTDDAGELPRHNQPWFKLILVINEGSMLSCGQNVLFSDEKKKKKKDCAELV